MKVHKYGTTLIVLFVLCLQAQPSLSQSRNQQSGTGRGVGIICRSDNNYEGDKISFPDKRIAIYDSPHGTIIGTIGRVSPKQEDRHALIFEYSNFKNIDVSHADKIEVVNDGLVLKYYKEDDEYAYTLTDTLPGGGWIRKTDLIANNFKTQSWLKFLLSRSNWEYHYKYNNLELKKAPNPTSETLTKIEGDLFYIKFTGKSEGPWAEVEVNRYDKHPSMEDGRVVEKLKGWIQAVDENGIPRVWYYTRGM